MLQLKAITVPQSHLLMAYLSLFQGNDIYHFKSGLCYNSQQYIFMKVFYPLKTSEPTNYVESLVKHIEDNYDMEIAYSFKPLLGKICQLRTKVTSLQTKPDMPDEELDKNIQMYSAYTKYALIILKRFNWDTDKGKSVKGVNIMWRDSFNPKIQYRKDIILFDVFCCYYNIAVMNFMRAIKLSQIDLDTTRKDAMTKAKNAAFLVKEMKQKYYAHFNNSGFNDTQFAHLDIIQNLCFGLVYKCLYNAFKSNQYKVGINKIAAICQMAQQYFLKAYSVASNFFMNPSGITDKTKTEILSISYIQSLYFDVLANTKYAKYYAYLMEKDPTQLPIVIAYERKAHRLLDIGLKNQSVQMLFNLNKAQKTELVRLQEEITQNLQKNLARNQQIYKQPEIKEENIPHPADFPQEWLVKLVLPSNLVMENEGEFAKLLTEQAYNLSLQLVNFSNSRKTAMESSMKKLETDIQKLFNDSYVNFYTQLQNQSTIKTIPRTLQQKLLQVKKKGGRIKLENDIKSLKDNQANANRNFMQLRQIITDEQYFDGQKRSQYGNKWSRPPSSVANKEYIQRIDNLEKKTKIAQGVDQKILDKYQRNQKYIDIMNSSDQAIINSLPKPQATKFIDANKEQLQLLKQKHDNIQKHKGNLQEIGHQISDKLNKQNYPILANTFLAQKLSQQEIFKTVFKDIQVLINNFNDECKTIKDQAQAIAAIAMSLNGKNKDQQKNKRQFEEVISHYNQIGQLYGEFTQSGVFYTKLNQHISKLIGETEDFAYARKLSAQDLENSINKKGGGGFVNNLPDMYPGKKKEQVPQFVPPPPPPQGFLSQNSPWQLLDKVFGFGQNLFGGGDNQNQKSNQNQNQGNNHGFMSSNPFSGGYQQPLNFPSNPFEGPVFPSGYGNPNNNRR